MRTILTVLVFAVVVCGCTSVNRAATTRLRWSDGKRKFEWTSPKDYTVGRMTVDPETGRFLVTDLSAQVDQAAVQAAVEARKADASATAAIVTGALGLAENALRSRAGLPPTIKPNGQPKDDPSTPVPVIPEGFQLVPIPPYPPIPPIPPKP